MFSVPRQRVVLEGVEGTLDTSAFSPYDAECLPQEIDAIFPSPTPLDERVEAPPKRGVIAGGPVNAPVLRCVESERDPVGRRRFALSNSPRLVGVLSKGVTRRLREMLGQRSLDDPGFELQAPDVE